MKKSFLFSYPLYIFNLKCLLLTFLLSQFVEVSSAQKPKNQKEPKNQDKNPNKLTQEADFLFYEGLREYASLDYKKALYYFEQAIQYNPNSVALLFKVADCDFQLKNYQEALINAKKALELDQYNKYIYLLIVKIYEQQENYGELIKIYQTIIDRVPKSDKYYLDLAECYARLKKNGDALDALEKLESKLGVNLETTHAKMIIYMRNKDLKKAYIEAEKMIMADPNSLDLLLDLLEVLVSEGKTTEAINLLEKLTMQGNQDTRIPIFLSKIKEIKGNRTESSDDIRLTINNPNQNAEVKIQMIIDFLRKDKNNAQDPLIIELMDNFVKQYPQNPKGLAVYGDIFYVREEKEKAYSYYANAASFSPDFPELWQQLLQTSLDLYKIKDLLKYAEEAIDLYPNLAFVRLYQGIGYVKMNNYEEALKSLNEGIRLAGDKKNLANECRSFVAECYFQLGDSDKGTALYEEILKDEPKNQLVMNSYAFQLALQNERLTAAKTMTEQLLAVYPQNIVLEHTYGLILYQQGNYAEAKQYLERSAMNPANYNGLTVEHYGDLLFQLGDIDAALVQWERAKNMGGSSTKIDQKILNKSIPK